MARLWRRPVSPRAFVWLALVAVTGLYVVVASGAFVRLTASGLGCDNWPRCGDRPFPEKGFHAFVEFGNRVVALAGILLALVAWHAARHVDGLAPWVRRTALAALAGSLAQIPLGGLTVVLDLHPVMVMMHFLLALAVLGLAVVVAIEAWSRARGLGAAIGPRWWRLVATGGVPVCAALVVTGAISTASGPHSGGDDIPRLGVAITDAVYVHVRASAVYGVGFLVVGGWLVRHRRSAPGILRLGAVLAAVLVAQMAVGELQYRNALPWGLVLVHVVLGAAVWSLTVAVVHTLWRPPRPLLSPVAAEAAAIPAGERRQYA
jgi:cytochrome c oxidase assembly protein subunit 15